MNNFPISAAQLGEGLQNAGSSLTAAGNSFEKSIALLTAAMASTQDISKSSTGLRTIAARIRNATSELEDLGEEVDDAYNTTAKLQAALKAITGVDILEADQKTFKDTYEILEEISKVWDKLSDVDKASVTKMLAGTRQTNVFSGVLKNFNEAEKVMESVNGSAGSMADAYGDYLDSIEGKLGEFTAAFEDFSKNVLGSWFVKNLVEMGTVVVKITSAFGGFAPAALTAGVALSKLWKAFTPATETTKAMSAFMGLKGVLPEDNEQMKNLIAQYNSMSALQQKMALNRAKLTEEEKDYFLSQVSNLAIGKQIYQNDVQLAIEKAKQKGAIESTTAAKLLENNVDEAGLIIDKEQLLTDINQLKTDGLITAEQQAEILSTLGLTAAKKGYVKTTWEAVKANLALKAASPMFWITTVISAITIISSLVSLIKSQTESLTEKLDEAKRKTEESAGELETLNSELETTKDRIEELEAIENPTIIEAEELERLKESNKQLEARIKLKKEEWSLDRRKEAETVNDWFESYSDDNDGFWEQMEVALNGVAKANRLAASADELYLSTGDKKYADQAEAYRRDVQEYIDGINQAYDEISKEVGDLDRYEGDNLTNAQKAVNEMLDRFDEFRVKRSLLLGEDYSLADALNTLIGKDEFDTYGDDVIKFITDHINNLDGALDDLEAIQKRIKTYNDAVNGNVDYGKRPYISPAEMLAAGWEDFDGQVATTFSSEYFIGTTGNGNPQYAIEITPILEDGTVLSPGELKRYVDNLITDSGIQGILNSDENNLVINVSTKVGGYSKEDIDNPETDPAVILQKTIGSIKESITRWMEKAGLISADENGDFGTKIFGSIDDFAKRVKTVSELLALSPGGISGGIKILKQWGVEAKTAGEGTDALKESLNGIAAKVKALDETGEALGKLNDAFNDFKENGSVAFGTIKDITDKFKDVSGLESYIDKLTAADLTSEQLNETLSDLTYAYIDTKWKTVDLANADKDLVAAMLKEAGVSNSVEVATWAIYKAKVAVMEAESKTAEEITIATNAMLAEMGVSSDMREEITNLTIAYVKAQNEMSKALTESVKQRLKAYGIEIESITSLAEANAAIAGIINGHYVNANAAQALDPIFRAIRAAGEAGEKIKRLLDEVGFNPTYKGDKSSSSKSDSSKSDDPWKDAYEKERKALDHMYKMGYITTEKYYASIEKLDKKYFAGREKYLDEHNKLLEELLDGRNEIYEDNKKLEEDRLDRLADDDYDGRIAIWKKIAENAKNERKRVAGVLAKYLTAEEMERNETIQSLREDERKANEEIKKLLRDQFDGRIKELDNELKREQDLMTASADKELSILKKKESLIRKAYKDGVLDFKEYVEQMNEVLVDKMGVVKDEYDTAANTIISYIDERIDAINDENDALEKQKELQEALADIEQKRAQRNKRLYIEGVGFIWTYDTKEVEDAEKRYKELRNQADRDADIRYWEALKEEIQNITDLESKLTDLSLTEKLFGKDWRNDLLDAEKFISDFAKNYGKAIGSIQSESFALTGDKEGVVNAIKMFGARWGELTPEEKKVVSALTLALGRSIGWSRDKSGHWFDEKGIKQFAAGGVVDYTGYAKVHGTRISPEVTFNATDAMKLYRLIHDNGVEDLTSRITGDVKSLPKANVNSNNVHIEFGGITVQGNADRDTVTRMSDVFDEKMKRLAQQIRSSALQNAYKK